MSYVMDHSSSSTSRSRAVFDTRIPPGEHRWRTWRVDFRIATDTTRKSTVSISSEQLGSKTILRQGLARINPAPSLICYRDLVSREATLFSVCDSVSFEGSVRLSSTASRTQAPNCVSLAEYSQSGARDGTKSWYGFMIHVVAHVQLQE